MSVRVNVSILTAIGLILCLVVRFFWGEAEFNLCFHTLFGFLVFAGVLYGLGIGRD